MGEIRYNETSKDKYPVNTEYTGANVLIAMVAKLLARDTMQSCQADCSAERVGDAQEGTPELNLWRDSRYLEKGGWRNSKSKRMTVHEAGGSKA